MISGMLFKLKLKAMFIHCLISLLIFSVIAYCVFDYFYPSFHLKMGGGLQGIALMFCVDVVLGPLLTFMVYNKEPEKTKNKLYFDFICIGLLQIGALIYGFYTVYIERPQLVLFFEDGNATVINARDLKETPFTQSVNLDEIQTFKKIGGIPGAFYGYDTKNRKQVFANVSEAPALGLKKSQENIYRYMEEKPRQEIEAIQKRVNQPLLVFEVFSKYVRAYMLFDREFNFIAFANVQELYEDDEDK